MTIIKLFLIVFLISFLMLIWVPFVTANIKYNTFITFIEYFCLSLFVIKQYEKKLSGLVIVILLIASILLLQFYTIYIYFVESIFSVPVLIFHCLGVISAFSYLKLRAPINVLTFCFSFLLMVFMFLQGWDYWIHMTNYGTFTGRVTRYKLPVRFESFDEQKNPIIENDFSSKIVLLDFWTTTCGVCFKKFPQLQAIHEKYKSDSTVAIFAVDNPIEEDKPDQAFEMIKERGYSFPVVILKDEHMAEKLGVKGYPTTFVIDREGGIVFKGDIEGAVQMVDQLSVTSQQ